MPTRTFKIFRGMNSSDAFVMVLVSAVTVMADLAVAVIVGVLVSALVFAWKHAKQVSVKTHVDDEGWKVYDLDGPIFFGSITGFKDLFDPENDPEDVVIDFKDSRVWDSSGVEALDNLTTKYENAGKKLHLRHLSPECWQLLKNGMRYVEVNINEDPRYRIATDELG